MGRVPGSQKGQPDDFMKRSAKAEKVRAITNYVREEFCSRVKTLSEVKRENPELLQPSKLKTKMKPGIPPKARLARAH
eukprot:2873811-Amphidinium_carterae.2